MTAPRRQVVVTETHTLTHADIVQAIEEFTRARSKLEASGACIVKISPDNSWGAKNEYYATATLTVTT